MTNFVFIAPPAAGKGTQSKYLVDKYDYIHISTGDLLREEIAKGTNLGIQINEIISSGKLVDDNMVLELLKGKLIFALNSNQQVIIDGFPRTLNQANMLDNLFKELSVDNYKVIYMDLSFEEAKKRVLGRLICSGCGKSYNDSIESLMPKNIGICDECGKALEKRSDDTEETFKERFDTYILNTKPIIDYYNKKDVLINVNASKDAEDVFKDIETYVTEVK